MPRVTVAGGIGKMVKLAQGRLDLHSKRGSVDLAALAAMASRIGASDATQAAIISANTAAEALTLAPGIGQAVAEAAWIVVADVLGEAPIDLDIAVFDHKGALVGHARNLRR